MIRTLFELRRFPSTAAGPVVLAAACLTFAGCSRDVGPPVRSSPEPQTQPADPMLAELSRTSEFPLRGRVYVPDNVRFDGKVVFGSVQGRDLTADIFTPQQTPLTPRPAIVSLHGGSWRSGDPSQFYFHSTYLVARYGFFAMCVDYRLSGEAKFPAALQDAKCAIRWLRAHALELNIDPERIAVMGGSAGAHLASMIATTAGVKAYEGDGGNAGLPDHANLVILFNGEFDMWDLIEKRSLIKAMRAFMGGTSEEVPEKYDELSSIKRIHKEVPPTLLLHGTRDRCVSHEQSLAFDRRLKELGVHSEIEIYPDKPHAWFNREPDRTVTLERMERFLVAQFDLQAQMPR